MTLRFSLYPTEFSNNLDSIISLIAIDKQTFSGTNILDISFDKGSATSNTKSMRACFFMDYEGTECFTTIETHPLLAWIDVMAQIVMVADNKSIVKLFIDGQLLLDTRVNIMPMEYQNVTLFAGHPWGYSTYGWIHSPSIMQTG